jgi:hypothetical protein
MPLPKFSDPRLSLWQSSVSTVLHRHLGSNDTASVAQVVSHEVMQAASRAAEPYVGLRPGDPVRPTSVATAWYLKIAAYLQQLWHTIRGQQAAPTGQLEICADLYLRLALTQDPAEKQRIQQQILDFGTCDPRWSEVITEYEKHVDLLGQPVPYIPPSSANEAVFDVLPERATIGLLADWGTGTPAAVKLLQLLAVRRKPGIPFFLIHLGDVYYSGTSMEFQRFVRDCRGALGGDVPVFTLAGNHDMYSGGKPYYDAIGSLNAAPFIQRTSYFNLRNAHWQFQAMDTGLNDRDPWQVDADTTVLDPAEVQWHRQQLAAAGGRKVVLLSHHQPFSAFARIGGQSTNEPLLSVFNGRAEGTDGRDYLPQVVLWLWGHEHNMVFYGPSAGVAKGRCIGSGAIPVTVQADPYKVLARTIPFDRAGISDNDGTTYSHGYAVMEIDGPKGRVEYFQDPDPNGRNPLCVDIFDAS